MADPTRESPKPLHRLGLSGRAGTRARGGSVGFIHRRGIPASALGVSATKSRLKHGEHEEPRRSTKPCDKPDRAAWNSIITAAHTGYPAVAEPSTHAVSVYLRGSSCPPCLSLADGDARTEPAGTTQAPQPAATILHRKAASHHTAPRTRNQPAISH
jgi:hypothetical protein